MPSSHFEVASRQVIEARERGGPRTQRRGTREEPENEPENDIECRRGVECRHRICTETLRPLLRVAAAHIRTSRLAGGVDVLGDVGAVGHRIVKQHHWLHYR